MDFLYLEDVMVNFMSSFHKPLSTLETTVYYLDFFKKVKKVRNSLSTKLKMNFDDEHFFEIEIKQIMKNY